MYLGNLGVLWDTWEYVGVLGDTFGYLRVLVGTCEYLRVLVDTWGYKSFVKYLYIIQVLCDDSTLFYFVGHPVITDQLLKSFKILLV